MRLPTKRKKNKPPYTAKLTALTYTTALRRFKSTARKLGIPQADLLTEALKDVIEKYK